MNGAGPTPHPQTRSESQETRNSTTAAAVGTWATSLLAGLKAQTRRKVSKERVAWEERTAAADTPKESDQMVAQEVQ
ncbi:hypothetical protein HDU98_001446, partial [Podochytrium sp. JEL0797]